MHLEGNHLPSPLNKEERCDGELSGLFSCVWTMTPSMLYSKWEERLACASSWLWLGLAAQSFMNIQLLHEAP